MIQCPKQMLFRYNDFYNEAPIFSIYLFMSSLHRGVVVFLAPTPTTVKFNEDKKSKNHFKTANLNRKIAFKRVFVFTRMYYIYVLFALWFIEKLNIMAENCNKILDYVACVLFLFRTQSVCRVLYACIVNCTVHCADCTLAASEQFYRTFRKYESILYYFSRNSHLQCEPRSKVPSAPLYCMYL